MRAQVEIMGLMIIVIMISLLLFFGMVFLLDSGEPTRPVVTEFSDIQLIENFGTSVRGTHSSCPRHTSGFYTLGEVLDFCVRGVDTCSNDKTNCEYFNNTLLSLLENTFTVYGLDYALNISSSRGDTIFFNETGSCSSPLVSGYSNMLPSTVSSDRGNFQQVFLTLKICP